MVYEPREDSDLLNGFVKEYSKDKVVLDLGTGSGIQAISASEVAKEVLAVDISKDAVSHVREQIKSKGLNNTKVLQSDLFSDVEGKFDLIIFNPPYLPEEKDDNLNDEDRKALYGGEKGYELILKFLSEVKDYLNERGKILLLFSSLSNKETIDSTIKKEGMHFKQLIMEAHFFERLYVYEVYNG